MKIEKITLIVFMILMTFTSCKEDKKIIKEKEITAADILGNSQYQAISYGGYRQNTRDIQPTIEELKEDMKLLSAMKIKVLRTYNVHLNQAANLLEAISQLKKENAEFEMYLMLGAWIDCKNAFTESPPDHNEESEKNAIEIARAIELAIKYPDIVKVIAVGNEAMVRWATSYFVQPKVILKWVNHLQDLKKQGKLSKDLWITSSDDFASWGGGDLSYHVKDLEELIKAVDYISMHTYPMHNSYYNPSFWVVPENEKNLSKVEKIDAAMNRSIDFAKNQYKAVADYMKSLGVNKPIHIGESGWSTVSNGHYGPKQSGASDEYKAGLYYKNMRDWTNKENISCFYFEAFDEQWKDANNVNGSENHFGLFNLKGQAKYAIWDLVDKGVFDGLTRDGHKITKSFNGNIDSLIKSILPPPNKGEFKGFQN